jgi:hypothetical protein
MKVNKGMGMKRAPADFVDDSDSEMGDVDDDAGTRGRAMVRNTYQTENPTASAKVAGLDQRETQPNNKRASSCKFLFIVLLTLNYSK